MAKNITLKLDERLLKKGRMAALERGCSMSEWVAELIENGLKDASSMERRRARALSFLDQGFKLGGKPLSRDEIYER